MPGESLLPPQPRSATLTAADGVRIHYQHWPVDAPRAGVLVSHGLGEHGGRYAALARDLAPRGISVCAIDHRGHGRSGGPRAYARRFEQVVEDLEALRRELAAGLFAGLPVFLLGHSLGGLVAIRHLQAHPGVFRGAVLSAPLLGVAVQAARWKVAFSGVLSKLIPALPIPNEITPGQLSRDEAYVRSYLEDPLVHTKITPRLYTEFMAHIGHASADAGRLDAPLLFVVPTADVIVQPAAVLRFAQALAGDVTIRSYEGYRHESFNDLGRERVIDDIAAWIEARL
ncbi:MAG TPA: alpha/beta hydrolase [Longimicrobiaceae bacterium]|nr:alpha/beta hydrolase [Longimicrobiaceae bacterium]